MNRRGIDLALAFLQSRPASAAAVLELQPAESVADFLREVPHRHAAAVLQQMLPRYVAKVCGRLEPTVAAGFLSEMDVHTVVAILRHADPSSRKKILGRLPERTKIACRLLLRYSEDAVGAWMVANIVTLPDDCTTREACERLAAEEDAVDTDAVHVVDREGKLRGVVGVTKLLRAASDTLALSIAENDPEAISGRAALASAKDHPVWARRDTLAVINRHRKIVGILRHVDLRRGLDHLSNTIAQPKGSDPLAGILEVYGTSLLALAGTAFEAVARPRPRGGQR